MYFVFSLALKQIKSKTHLDQTTKQILKKYPQLKAEDIEATLLHASILLERKHSRTSKDWHNNS
jgi:uncharacterized protein (DUF433 family)